MAKSFNSRKKRRKKGNGITESSDGFLFKEGDRGFGSFAKEETRVEEVARLKAAKAQYDFDVYTKGYGNTLKDIVTPIFNDVFNAISDAALDTLTNTTESAIKIAKHALDPEQLANLSTFIQNPFFGIVDLGLDIVQDLIDALATPKPPKPSGSGLYPPGSPFVKYPTRYEREEFWSRGGALDVNTNKHYCWLQRRRYVDQRQQYEAVAVAKGNHPWYRYLSTEGTKSFFSYWTWDRGLYEWRSDVCIVEQPLDDFWLNWEWGGTPPDTSDLTAGQYMITWATWATYFLANTIYDWDKTGFNGLTPGSARHVPCELGDHKDASLTPQPGGAVPGPSNPYGPEGCLIGLPCPLTLVDYFKFDGGRYDIFTSGVSADSYYWNIPLYEAQFWREICPPDANGFSNIRLSWERRASPENHFSTLISAGGIAFDGGVIGGATTITVRVSRGGLLIKQFGPEHVDPNA